MGKSTRFLPRLAGTYLLDGSLSLPFAKQYMKGLKDQSIQKVQIPFTTPRNSIPDEERLFQEPLSHCAGFGASVPVPGQKLWRFQVIYQQLHTVIPTPMMTRNPMVLPMIQRCCLIFCHNA